MKEILPAYNLLYISAFLACVLLIISFDIKKVYYKKYDFLVGCFIIIGLTYLFGSRDFSVGTDTPRYLMAFQFIWRTDSFSEAIISPFVARDPYFNGISYLFSKVVDIRGYFYVLAFLLVAPLFCAAYRMTNVNRSLVLVAFMSLFCIPNFGVNIMRNGLSLSFAILAITYLKDNKLKIGIAIASISVAFHLSSIVIFFMYVLSSFIKNKWYVLPVFFGSIFLALLKKGLKDLPIIGGIVRNQERLMAYNQEGGGISSLPLSYLLMHLATVAFALYLSTVIKDKFYHKLTITYMLLSSFYFLTSTMAFSYRFGILAWVLTPIILIYPLMTYRIFKRFQFTKLLGVIFVLALFSLYILNI
ncbi:EpsG family protein [Sinomicrobium soli]|uniref:EpsG family protein n=1 Tax=Sinomicrobium sp. N-1-3-6 TaxID=2219864 RepID=UPI001374E3E0|nr:EpsG family protein [Sinomicrobium sp. N-1-3-6]